jgi:hypothetical protein
VPTPDADENERRSAASWLAERTPGQWGMGLLLIALAISAPFGGLDRAVDRTEHDLEPGNTVTARPFEIEIEKVRQVSTLDPVMTPDEGNKILCALGKVTVDAQQPVFAKTLAEAVLFQDAGVIDPPPGQMPATVLSRQDGSLIDLLQPGVEYDVAVCAQQDGAWQRRQVRVGVAQFDFRDDERFRLFTKEWYYDKPVHSGDYDVEIRS